MSTPRRSRLARPRLRRLAPLAIAALPLVAAGCGGDDDPAAQPTNAPTVVPATAAAPTGPTPTTPTAAPTPPPAPETAVGTAAPTGTPAPSSGGAGDAALGQQIAADKGCVSCHQLDTDGVGPKWAGLYGSPVELDDGSTVVADEAYLRMSITDPGAQRAAGYFVEMPAVSMEPAEVDHVVAYLVSVGAPPA